MKIEVTDKMEYVYTVAFSAEKGSISDRRRAGLAAVLATVPFTGPITLYRTVPESETALQLRLLQESHSTLIQQYAKLDTSSRERLGKAKEQAAVSVPLSEYTALQAMYGALHRESEIRFERAADLRTKYEAQRAKIDELRASLGQAARQIASLGEWLAHTRAENRTVRLERQAQSRALNRLQADRTELAERHRVTSDRIALTKDYLMMAIRRRGSRGGLKARVRAYEVRALLVGQEADYGQPGATGPLAGFRLQANRIVRNLWAARP